jgi:predicted DNA-binding protein (MmcQ/YjbR family)
VDLERLRQHCLSKPGAVEGYPFGPGVLVIKVSGKVFAIIAEEPEHLQVSLKCDPEIALMLRKTHDCVTPGYHLNKRHWNTVTLDGTVADTVVREWIDDSFDLVVEGLPRRARTKISRL